MLYLSMWFHSDDIDQRYREIRSACADLVERTVLPVTVYLDVNAVCAADRSKRKESWI